MMEHNSNGASGEPKPTRTVLTRTDLEILLARQGSRGLKLSGVSLNRADLSGLDLRGADFSGADLTAANLSGANLEEANLGEANFFIANLRKANLRQANLQNARLNPAELGDANLSGANLRGADLSSTELVTTILSGADLTNADLTDAYLTVRQKEELLLSGRPVRGANAIRLVFPPGEDFPGFKSVPAAPAPAPVESAARLVCRLDRPDLVALDLAGLLEALNGLYAKACLLAAGKLAGLAGRPATGPGLQILRLTGEESGFELEFRLPGGVPEVAAFLEKRLNAPAGPVAEALEALRPGLDPDLKDLVAALFAPEMDRLQAINGLAARLVPGAD